MVLLKGANITKHEMRLKLYTPVCSKKKRHNQQREHTHHIYVYIYTSQEQQFGSKL